MTLTVADYLFKSYAAQYVPPQDLGSFFASVYLGLNALSLAIQLLLVGWLIRILSVSGALAILPALLVLGGVGLVVGGGLLAALVIKGTDGSLRHSLHRTSSELLSVPMSEQLRTRVKPLIDVLGQRGGQAVASVGILLTLAWGFDREIFGVAMIVNGAIWIGLAILLKRHYLDIFRHNLASQVTDFRLEFPDLDLASLESLLATLNSQNDGEVLAALEILKDENKVNLIPALILYHPSQRVVRTALDMFVAAGRTDFIPIVDRHLLRVEATLRTAFIRARTLVSPDEGFLRERLRESCKVCRTTAMVHLVAYGWTTGERARELLETITAEGPELAQQALAESIGHGVAPGLEDYVVRLSDSPNAAVRTEVARALGKLRQLRHLPVLVKMLAERSIRTVVRKAIVHHGEDAIDPLVEMLGDPEMPQVVRWQLPRTICAFRSPRAADVLLRHLPTEPDSMIRYRIAHEVTRLRSLQDDLRLDRAVLDHAVEHIIQRACSYLDWRLMLERGAVSDATVTTDVHELLVRMLHDKERNSIRSLIRILGLLYPREDFSHILYGLRSKSREAGASSRELLEHAVGARFRRPVLGLVDDAPDAQRLAQSQDIYAPVGADYRGILQILIDGTSETLSALAVYHVAELAWTDFRPMLAELETEPSSILHDVIERARRLLAPGNVGKEAVAHES